MDSSSQMVKPKQQKLDGGQEMGGGREGLNNLPDVVIEKIISLLPMKEAIRTSVLSRRWEYLWTSIPNLDFYFELHAKRSSLVNIVDRSLFLRGPADIKRVHLSFHVRGDVSRVSAWISAIVQRNVEELILDLDSHKEPFSLPQSLVSSATLKVLHLCLPCSFQVSSAVCLSSLKRLTLTDVVFHEEYSIQQLFSGCPVLEELTLEECNWANLKFVSIFSPNLIKLIINERQSPSRGSNVCQIRILGVSLEYFSYSGHLVHDYFLGNSSVHEARIDIQNAKGTRLVSYLLHKLLEGLYSVKDLTVSHSHIEAALTGAPELLAHMPVFNDLTILTFEQGPLEIDGKLLLGILQRCPCLEDLSFYAGITLSSDNGNDNGLLDPLPPCFLTSLKIIEVGRLDGTEEEIYALRVLLKNALVLENIYIKFDSGEWEPEKKRVLKKQISGLPKGSECCEVVMNL